MEWFEKEDECVVGERGVTLQMVPLTREKRPDEKKLEMIERGNRRKLTDERKKKEKKCHKDPQPARQGEKKKKTRKI